MENKSTQDRIVKKNKKSKNGTMSFLDHLDELRRRLIRYFIVLIVCVLVAYVYRVEILNLAKKPVDVPLKKYTATHYQSAPDVPLSSLNSYACSCQEIPLQPQESATDEQNKTVDAKPSKAPTPATPPAPSLDFSSASKALESSGNVVKESINDFVVYFQVTLGMKPSPIFESEKYSKEALKNTATGQAKQSLKGQLNLNCQCTLGADDGQQVEPRSTMVFIGLPELFFAQMKVAMFAGFFLSFPFLLIELWGFIGPALYRGEKKVFWIFAISSYVFFIGGALFGYFIVFPFGFDFFLSLTQVGEIMPSLSIGEYLGFAVKLLLAFGFIFELPLVTFILARMGIVTPEMMIRQGRVAIVVIFIVSGLLTPPDPFTIFLMAIPLLLLYVLSIGVCLVGVNRKKEALRKQGIDPDESDE